LQRHSTAVAKDASLRSAILLRNVAGWSNEFIYLFTYLDSHYLTLCAPNQHFNILCVASYQFRILQTHIQIDRTPLPKRIFNFLKPSGGPGSSVSTATGYGLDCPAIELWCGRDFPHLYRLALGPTQPPVQLVKDLSRG
jgi:hypothetical protein